MWTARRILKELVPADRRAAVLSSFWRYAEPSAKIAVQTLLARAMNFREETVRKMSPEKKGELLAARISLPELEHWLEMALMLHHTREKSKLMAAFLDRWNVPHDDGSIESDDYTPPAADAVRDAVGALSAEYDRDDILLYLATAGLLMDEEWQRGTWPVVDEMIAGG